MSTEAQEKTGFIVDFQLVLKPLFQFLSINATLFLLIYFLALRNNQNIEPNSTLAALFILLIFALIIIYPITFYLFLKKVALLKKVPYKINRMGPYFLRLLQFYIIQYLIVMAILLGIVILSSIFSTFSKHSNSILTPIITFCFLLFGIYWFYRLFFAPYILLFQRSNYSAGNIIIESKFLVKKNIAFIILMVLLPILVSIPSFIGILKNPGTQQFSYLILIVSTVTQIITIIGCLLITINEVNHNNEYASELIKNEES